MKLVAFFCLFSALFAVSLADKEFCFGWECPNYEVLQSTDAFEVRRYESANWASAKLSFNGTVDDSYLNAITEASQILKEYRLGNNEGQVELNHTFPMRVMVVDNHDQVDYVISYYLPSLAQEHPPTPRDERLTIEKIETHTVAVRWFRHGAMSWSHHAEPEFTHLSSDLEAAGINFLRSPQVVAMYDRRAKHTEVFLIMPDAENNVVGVPAVGEPKPDFCGDRDCPDFEVTRSTRTYDIRKYAEANWAVVNVTLEGDIGDNYGKAVKVAWPLLYGYRMKGNSKEVEMAHTVPMLVVVDERCFSNYSKIASFLFAYFIPFKYQDNIPQPTDKRVNIVSLRSISLGVRSFSGIVLSWDKQVEKELDKLRQDLQSHDEKFHSCIYSFAQYHILKIKDRHNEVAFWIKGEDEEPHPLLSVSVPSVADVAPAAVAVAGPKPDFCGDNDCPDYDVTRSTRTYDIRKYAKANWAVVNVTLDGDVDENWFKATKIAAPLLHGYRMKGNLKEVEMAHTVPMLVAVDQRLSTDSNKKVSFLFAYFIPFQWQNDVPEPTDKRVRIRSLGPVSLGVRSFPGIIISWDKQVKVELDKLSQDLDSHGEQYHADSCAFAQYHILKIKDRHNEVSLWMKGDDSEPHPLLSVNAPAVSIEEEAAVQEHPDFCGDKDCPEFELTRSTRTYDVRKYAQANWAVVNITLAGSVGGNYFKAVKEAAAVLLAYRNKENSKKVEMAHTVPMLVGVDHRSSSGSDKASFLFAYFIPFQWQNDVPQPTDKRIHVTSLGPVSVAVRSFSGIVFSWDKQVKVELEKLREDLDSHDEKYFSDFCAFAQYHIFKLKDRHNEVAFWLQEDGAASPFNSVSAPNPVIGVASRSENAIDETGVRQFVPPAFCHEHDCPSYDVLRSGKSFEVRKYSTAKWLTYNITAHKPFVQDRHFKLAIETGMQLIRDYNNGHNEHGLQIPMTVPVRILAHEHDGAKRDHVKYVVAFYIPVKYQEDPPKPFDERLNIHEISDTTVAVRAFNAISQDWDKFLLPQVDKLAVDLSSAGEDYEKDHTFISYYDYPAGAAPLNPYGEVWLVVKE